MTDADRRDLYREMLAELIGARDEIERLKKVLARSLELHAALYRELAGEPPTLSTERSAELEAMPYRTYLDTQEWHTIRDRMRTMAAGRCRLCDSTERVDVHHRRYGPRGLESPNDLVVLCRKCHGRFHDAGVLE